MGSRGPWVDINRWLARNLPGHSEGSTWSTPMMRGRGMDYKYSDDTDMTDQGNETDEDNMDTGSSKTMRNTRESQTRRTRGRGGGVKRRGSHVDEIKNKSPKKYNPVEHDKFTKFIPTRSSANRIRNSLRSSAKVIEEKPKGRVLRKRKITIKARKESEDDNSDSDGDSERDSDRDSDRDVESDYIKGETKEENHETFDSSVELENMLNVPSKCEDNINVKHSDTDEPPA